MNQPTGFKLGAGAIARLLAGAPPANMEIAAFPAPWQSLAQAIAGASGDQRLAAFDAALSRRSESQAADIWNQVGEAGRAILQGTPPSAPRPQIASADLLDLPQEA